MNACKDWYKDAGQKTTECITDTSHKNKWGGYDCNIQTVVKPGPPPGYTVQPGKMAVGAITKYSKDKAKSIGVAIKPSTCNHRAA